MTSVFVLRSLVILATLAILGSAAPVRAQLRCQTVPQLAAEYLKGHVEINALTDELESRAIDTYVRRVDASRTVFTEPEAAEARQALDAIFDRMKKGDCEPLFKLHESVVAKNTALEEFVRKTVNDPNFELDQTVSLQLQAGLS